MSGQDPVSLLEDCRMSGLRGYVDRLVSRISQDRILPWEIDPEIPPMYVRRARKAGF
jgi:hypothetical protein